MEVCIEFNLHAMRRISVTIGIPIYQVQSCVERALNTALSQTYDNIDFILVDDCGTDNSMKIVNSIIKESHRKDRIQVIRHDENKGLGEARNTVIRNTKTDYVYFMDSDDTIEQNTIELLIGKVKKYDNPDIIIANHKTIYMDGREVVSTTVGNDTYLSSNQAILSYFNNNSIRISSWNKLFSTKFLKDNSIIYLHRFHEDFFFSLQEIYNANSILIVPDTTYNYILRSQSITGGLQLTSKMVERLIPVANDIKSFIKSHDVNDCIIAKKYIDLISHILYVAFVVDFFDKKALLLNYKKENIPFRFVCQKISFLSRSLILGYKLPSFLLTLYWRLMFKFAQWNRS